MSDILLNLIFLALSLSLAIIGAIIAAWLQHRSWQNQNWEKTRNDRTQIALNTIREISKLTDRRLYRQRRVIWAINSADDERVKIAVADYQSILFEWMDKLGRIKSELWASFDLYTAVSFEVDIHDDFAKNGRAIEARLRKLKNGRSLAGEESDLNNLGKKCYQFSKELQRRVDEEDLAGLRDRNMVSFENWTNLSSVFLIRRLFGLSKKSDAV